MAWEFIKAFAGSNKVKTLPQEPDQGPSEHPEPLSPGHQLQPFIDKISIVITPPDEEQAHLSYKAIMLMADEPEVFINAGPKTKWGKFNFAKRIPLTKSPARPLFQAELKAKKAVTIRLEFNPRKVGADGFVELQSILMCLIDYGWGSVIEHGKITRIDIAVDLPSTRPAAFAVLPQQALVTKDWAVNGKLETFAMGKPKGNQTVVYNKKKQRLAQKQPWDGPSVTRVERRLRNPPISSLKELPNLPNPFHAMTLVEMPDAPENEKQKWIWQLFKDAVTVRNLPAALALVPKERRTMYRAHLEKHQHELWDPDAIWKNWPAALNELKMHILK
jgi:hypothetical protein